MTVAVMSVCAAFLCYATFLWSARWPSDVSYKVDRFGLNGARIGSLVGSALGIWAVVHEVAGMTLAARLIIAVLLPALLGAALRARWERQHRETHPHA